MQGIAIRQTDTDYRKNSEKTGEKDGYSPESLFCPDSGEPEHGCSRYKLTMLWLHIDHTPDGCTAICTPSVRIGFPAAEWAGKKPFFFDVTFPDSTKDLVKIRQGQLTLLPILVPKTIRK